MNEKNMKRRTRLTRTWSTWLISISLLDGT